MMFARMRSARRSTARLVGLLAAGTAAALAVALPAAPAQAATAQFTPGQAWTDTSGSTLQLHGLGIVKVGSTWYGFGEDKAGESSSNDYFQDVPCYSSTDLQHWTLQGKALTRQSTGDLGPNRIVERPKVIYNSSTATYVMYVHIDNTAYSEAKVGVATSSTPCGPYSYRGSFQPLGHISRDLGLFQDTDGSAYLLSEDRASGLRIDKLSSDYLSVTSAVTVLGDYEAPAMVKVAGRYFILGSHLTGWSTNDDVYASATSLSGPWSSFQDFAPAGTNTYNTQVSNIITVQGTSGTTYIYTGDRWTTSDLGSSPLVWLPLTISGSTVSLTWYSSWTLDTVAGTWSTGSSTGATTGPLHAVGAGKCLDDPNSTTTTGTQQDIRTCNAQPNQTWTHTSAGALTVTVGGQTLCLDANGKGTTNGTKAIIYTCNGQTNQQWNINSNGTITGAMSGLCLDVTSAAITDGTPVELWTCNGGSNQQWTLG
jgi:beta-xylosidase